LLHDVIIMIIIIIIMLIIITLFFNIYAHRLCAGGQKSNNNIEVTIQRFNSVLYRDSYVANESQDDSDA